MVWVLFRTRYRFASADSGCSPSADVPGVRCPLCGYVAAIGSTSATRKVSTVVLRFDRGVDRVRELSRGTPLRTGVARSLLVRNALAPILSLLPRAVRYHFSLDVRSSQ